jgi:hypothetical protein
VTLWNGGSARDGNDEEFIIIIVDVTKGINQKCKLIRKIDV